jgi:hypothetical protein
VGEQTLNVSQLGLGSPAAGETGAIPEELLGPPPRRAFPWRWVAAFGLLFAFWGGTYYGYQIRNRPTEEPSADLRIIVARQGLVARWDPASPLLSSTEPIRLRVNGEAEPLILLDAALLRRGETALPFTGAADVRVELQAGKHTEAAHYRAGARVIATPEDLRARLANQEALNRQLSQRLPQTPAQAPPERPTTGVTGMMLWTGLLPPGERLEILRGRTNIGKLTGRLPARQIRVRALPAVRGPEGLVVFGTSLRGVTSDPPSPATGGQRTAFKADASSGASVTIAEAPGTHNGWIRMSLRAQQNAVTAILIEWEELPPSGTLKR